MMSPYLQRLAELEKKLNQMGSLAKLDIPFVRGRAPTQAFSEFLTNKEQGDWAERTFIDNFNKTNSNLWAVKYGRSEDLIAGDNEFPKYYESYQNELMEIGKRPDLLLFNRAEFLHQFGAQYTDISKLPPCQLDKLVPTAHMAIEVRSSAFISEKYAEAAKENHKYYCDDIYSCARELLDNYSSELRQFSEGWYKYISDIIKKGVIITIDSLESPRAFSRKSTARLQEITEITKQIKSGLKILSQRDFLSITPKAEDLTLVYRWIGKYHVPHHYCQVFFDKAVILSFEEILEILADPEKENVDYFIESDEKNQRKTTFKINIKLGREVMSNIELPEHHSVMRELPKGRLLFYVSFNSSKAVFSTNHFIPSKRTI